MPVLGILLENALELELCNVSKNMLCGDRIDMVFWKGKSQPHLLLEVSESVSKRKDKGDLINICLLL